MRSGFSLMVALAAVVSLVVGVGPTPASAASTSFGPWTFDYTVDSDTYDGLSISNVRHNGELVIRRAGLPAMTVYYDDNACGPYVDRLGGTLQDGPFSSTFTQDGVRWFSIGITDLIGNYVITQMYYFGENGELDLHMFSKGLQCNIRHDHYPFWRMDFDLGDTANDKVRRRTTDGWVTEDREFSLAATAAIGHDWEVYDTESGATVTIEFDDGSFEVGGETVPETHYANNRVYGRQHKTEEIRWVGGAAKVLPGDEDQYISDLVVFYNGFMPHSPEEGPDLWHSTGIRLAYLPDGSAPATIGDRVTDLSGSGVADVGVDLFSEGRTEWLGHTSTSSDGSYQFEVDPGCYVVTFIAPDGTSFASGRWYNVPVCVTAGETDDTVDARLLTGGAGASIGDQVTYSSGGGAAGVDVDLFTATESGGRDQFLRSTTTGSDGEYGFDVAEAGCYVVTFIAPEGSTFTNAGRYLNRHRCVTEGEAATDVDAVIASSAGGATVGGRIMDSDGGVADVGTDLFASSGGGSRDSYLRSTRSDATGHYEYSVSAGCYVVTFKAPDGRTFVASGSRWLNRSVCVAVGETVTDLNAVLD